MCEHCGCSDIGHGHEHGHEHKHERKGRGRTVSIETKVLARNDELAAANRDRLRDNGTIAVNMISAPGSGKTLLLEKTLDALKGVISCAVIAGDVESRHDADRLRGRGAKIHQIETKSSCHLNAEQISRALPAVLDPGTELLFIENVGNLVCPTAFKLGENFKLALLSTPEGEDKPVKYPALFTAAKAVVITKIDLIPHLNWDLQQCRRYLQQINPGIYIFELSALTGDGFDAWLDYLKKLAG